VPVRTVRVVGLGFRLSLDRPAFELHILFGLFAASLEHVADEEVVDDGSHHTAYHRPDYRNPEVAVNAWHDHVAPAGEPRKDPRAEVLMSCQDLLFCLTRAPIGRLPRFLPGNSAPVRVSQQALSRAARTLFTRCLNAGR
jgi:hypothetical protein